MCSCSSNINWPKIQVGDFIIITESIYNLENISKFPNKPHLGIVVYKSTMSFDTFFIEYVSAEDIVEKKFKRKIPFLDNKPQKDFMVLKYISVSPQLRQPHTVLNLIDYNKDREELIGNNVHLFL
jgi:hypothetical protein